MKLFLLIIAPFACVAPATSSHHLSIFSHHAQAARGPAAVRNGLIRGLKKLNISFNENPDYAQSAPIVMVLDDNHVLMDLLNLKKQGFIKKIFAGPNTGISKEDLFHLLMDPGLDGYLVPSQWPKDCWCSYNNALQQKIFVWPTGVDTDYWRPQISDKQNNVLIYWKNGNEQFYHSVEHLVRTYGWNPITVRYGSYQQDQFKKELERCRCAIFLTSSESQGIAQLESWSMNVPTLIFDPQNAFDYLSIRYEHPRSCPLLTRATGRTWKSVDELKILMENMSTILEECAPRKWVLDHMTDEKSTSILMNIINQSF